MHQDNGIIESRWFHTVNRSIVRQLILFRLYAVIFLMLFFKYSLDGIKVENYNIEHMRFINMYPCTTMFRNNALWVQDSNANSRRRMNGVSKRLWQSDRFVWPCRKRMNEPTQFHRMQGLSREQRDLVCRLWAALEATTSTNLHYLTRGSAED